MLEQVLLLQVGHLLTVVQVLLWQLRTPQRVMLLFIKQLLDNLLFLKTPPDLFGGVFLSLSSKTV